MRNYNFLQGNAKVLDGYSDQTERSSQTKMLKSKRKKKK
jgi:hypothetical protein